MLKKSKEYKKELKLLNEEEAEKYIVKMAMDFFNELKTFFKTNNSDNLINAKIKELDNKFQASLSDEYKQYGVLFRNILIDYEPKLKTIMMWN